METELLPPTINRKKELNYHLVHIVASFKVRNYFVYFLYVITLLRRSILHDTLSVQFEAIL